MKPEQERAVAGDIKAINAFRSQLIAAYNSNDAAATAAYYADDTIVTPPNQVAIEGKQAIQTWYEAMFKENAVRIALTPLETQVAGDWAYERGNTRMTVTPKSGKPTEQSLRYFVIVQRQPDGSWKIYRDTGNSGDSPPGAGGEKK